MLVSALLPVLLYELRWVFEGAASRQEEIAEGTFIEYNIPALTSHAVYYVIAVALIAIVALALCAILGAWLGSRRKPWEKVGCPARWM
ncbi:MAG: hypothetical protein HRF49_10910 [bacterium]|jgi:hypothetical protein